MAVGKGERERRRGTAPPPIVVAEWADPEWIQKITGLSAEQMQALEQPLPESKREPWIEY